MTGRRRLTVALLVLALIVALVAWIGTRDSDDAGRPARAPGWSDLLPPDSDALSGAAPVSSILAVTQWTDRLVVVTAAVADAGSSAWVTSDGRHWERSEFDPPAGCTPAGGVVAVGRRLAVSCHGPDDSLLSVATTSDLDRWDSHVVAPAGPSFGTTIGAGLDGGLTVTVFEAADGNTTEGSRLRVWTGSDLGTWTEIPGASDDVFLDAATHPVRVVDDHLMIAGAVTEYSESPGAGARWRPAVWTSTAGAPFTRIDLPAGTEADGPSGWVHDVTRSSAGYVAVGALNDQSRALAWTSPDLAAWTPATVDDAGSDGDDAPQVMWSVEATDGGTLLAGGVASPSERAQAWSSTDGGARWHRADDGPELLGRWRDTVVGARSGDRLRVLIWTDPAAATASSAAADPLIVDVGPVERVPPGGAGHLSVPGHGDQGDIVVRRDSSDQLVAFAGRSPTQGCRLVPSSELRDVPVAPNVAFHDPCHGSNFDLDGILVGGPGSRGMYRYDVTVAAGRIRVDTALLHPGPLRDGIDRIDATPTRHGVTDPVATQWRDAISTASLAVRGTRPHPFIWVLGAFHDPARDIVSIPCTVDGIIVEVSTGPASEFRDTTNATRRAGEAQTFELEAGTLYVDSTDPDPSSSRAVIADMAINGGRHLRIEAFGTDNLFDVLDVEDLVRLIDAATIIASPHSG